MAHSEPQLVKVHVSTQKGDAEFVFPSASYLLDGGALKVLDSDGNDLMAIAPGGWKAAWVCDPTSGKPLGLADAPFAAADSKFATPNKASIVPVAAIAAASTAPAPNAPQEGVQTTQASIDQSHSIVELLNAKPYKNLLDFSTAIRQSVDLVEKSISAAMAQNLIDFDKVALDDEQAKLDEHMPAIMANQPKSLSAIISILRQLPDLESADMVQLRVWLKRNPPKR